MQFIAICFQGLYVPSHQLLSVWGHLGSLEQWSSTGDSCVPREHLAVSADIFAGHSWRVGGMLLYLVGGGRDAARRAPVDTTAPSTKGLSPECD